MNLKLFLLLIFIITGCMSLPKNNNSLFRANLDLIIPHNNDLYKGRILDPPYIAKFNRKGKTLYYLAAVHESSLDFPDLLKSPTFSTIQKIFKENSINGIIVEGIASWSGDIPPNLLNHAKKCESIGYKINCGEPFYTINQAIINKAVIYSGEPSENEILNFVISKGYKLEDLLGFYVVRQIPEWKRQGQFTQPNIKPLIDQFLKSYKGQLGYSLNFGFNEFTEWYVAHVINPESYLSISNEDVSPHWDSEAKFLQKISGLVGIVRDRSIVSKIVTSIESHSNVLVVYGASHLLTQLPAIEDFMGKPEYIKYF